MKNKPNKLPVGPANNGAGEVTCGKGRGGSMTKAYGLGAGMVANLDRVVARARRQYADDRRAAAIERRVEVAARQAEALETLLFEVLNG